MLTATATATQQHWQRSTPQSESKRERERDSRRDDVERSTVFSWLCFSFAICAFPLCERRDSESVCVKMCALSRSGNFVFNDLLHTSAVAVLFKFERSNLQQRATQNTQRTQNVRVAVFSETENRSTTKKILKQHILKIPQHFGYKLQKKSLEF